MELRAFQQRLQECGGIIGVELQIQLYKESYNVIPTSSSSSRPFHTLSNSRFKEKRIKITRFNHVNRQVQDPPFVPLSPLLPFQTLFCFPFDILLFLHHLTDRNERFLSAVVLKILLVGTSISWRVWSGVSKSFGLFNSFIGMFLLLSLSFFITDILLGKQD